jgi:dTDP-4-amino-4,6-dideoxygalactose transaminase
VPHFVDCEPITLGVDAKKLRTYLASISELRNGTCYNRQTNRVIRALIVVHTFGHPADLDALAEVCLEYRIELIEDAAEGLGTLYKGRHVGQHGRLAALSFNGNKIITTGGGGAILTNDIALATRVKHLTTTAKLKHPWAFFHDEVGYNFRLGEIECAMGISQLKKLEHFVDGRQHVAQRLNQALSSLPGLTTPFVMPDCTHAYYVYPMVLNTAFLGVKRETLVEALHAEGVTGVGGGYQNVHLLPIFQKKVAYGSRGFPWTSDICKREVSYAKGICPVAEKYHDETYMGFAMCLHDLSNADVDLIAKAFHKVWENLSELKKLEEN